MTYPLVYQATNRINGKRYIGVTTLGAAKRRWQHENDARRKAGGAPKFHNAIRRYGPEAFDWTVLAEFETAEQALAAEADFIARLRPEYNITRGGRGALGQVWTPEMRARQSAIRVGMKFSEEHRRNLSKAHLGKKQSQETIEKRRQKKIGVPLTAEHRSKLSAAKLGHPDYWRGRKKSPESVRRGWETRRKNQEARRDVSAG